MRDNAGKIVLKEFLDYMKYKVDNDLLTMEEMESMARAIENDMTLLGTADDFARFYDQPRTNVSSVINRKMMQKPVRKVYYSFNAFRKIVPDKWKCHDKRLEISVERQRCDKLP